jgi:FtsP/CotA-like multicopper oxidase with cupredoxin domain
VAEAALLGGGTGVIVVDGIQNVVQQTSGLPERFLTIRDNEVPGAPTDDSAPAWDISLNYHPIPWPAYPAPVIEMRPGAKELWRVANTSADTIVDVQLQYDGFVQPLQVVAIDAVPTGTDDGSGLGVPITKTHFLVPSAGRVEFIVSGPNARVRKAQLLTLNIDTGPDGDNDPQRPLLDIQTSPNAPVVEHIPHSNIFAQVAELFHRFRSLNHCVPVHNRTVYFSEVLSNPSDSNSPTNFYITEVGNTPKLFNPNNPAAITVKQGTTEDWIIENRSLELHEFHIHQIHFLLLERNGKTVAAADRQYYDTIQVPYWSGTGPYPIVKVRMDFRGADIGEFVYHCHILGHEDNGMIAAIQVVR